ncbi:Proteasome subunit alpha type-6 [Diplonema papillatum]|nr:Proteasome subunit alpha type-6 [Diplonema papillatum]
MSRSTYDISVFSPEGRLYQVEYSFKTLTTEALTNVGLVGKDCAVVVAQKKVPDKLLKVDSVSHVFLVTKEIGINVCGRVPDGAAILDDARQHAGEFHEKYGYQCDVTWLARRLGENAQHYTQHAGYRPLGNISILFAMEKDDMGVSHPKIYTVDPAGVAIGYYATATGQKDNEVKQVLEKAYKKDMTLEETIMCGIQSLQKSLGANENSLTAADLQISVWQTL